jgi:hypothetical protein
METMEDSGRKQKCGRCMERDVKRSLVDGILLGYDAP